MLPPSEAHEPVSGLSVAWTVSPVTRPAGSGAGLSHSSFTTCATVGTASTHAATAERRSGVDIGVLLGAGATCAAGGLERTGGRSRPDGRAPSPHDYSTAWESCGDARPGLRTACVQNSHSVGIL